MFGASGEELFAQRESFRSAHVRPDFAKVFLDGVPGARTAAFHEPYTPDPVQGCCFRGTTLASVPASQVAETYCDSLGSAQAATTVSTPTCSELPDLHASTVY